MLCMARPSMRPGVGKTPDSLDEDPATLRPTISMFPAADAPRLTSPSLLPWKRRVGPWSPARVILTALAAGAMMLGAVVATAKYKPEVMPRRVAAMFFPHTEIAPASLVVGPTFVDRADLTMKREGRTTVYGGLLSIPPGFRSADGGYDLVLHFHGNTDAVEESVARTHLNAVLVTSNYGIGSGAYEDRFQNPAVLDAVLARTNAALAERGLKNPHLRRLALSAWSAGYGAVVRIVERPELLAKVDAVLLSDGIHAGFLLDNRTIDPNRMAAYAGIAEEAVAGRKLLSITHTEIDPVTYASTHATTDALLAMVGVEREPGGEPIGKPDLRSLKGVVADKTLRTMEPLSHAERGSLIVRGYGGQQPEDHMMQLFAIAETTLHDLAQRWATVEASP